MSKTKDTLYLPQQQTLDLVNELLATATPMGAYCLGVACCLSWKRRKEPPPEALRLIVKFECVEDVIDLLKYHAVLPLAECE